MKLPGSLLYFIVYFLKREPKYFFLIPLFACAWALDNTLFPYIFKMVIDVFGEYENNRALVWTGLTLPVMLGLSLWISVECSYRLAGLLTSRLYPKLEATVRMAMFDYTERHSYSFFSQNFAGALGNKISDMTWGITTLLDLIGKIFLPVSIGLVIAISLFSLIQPLFGLILAAWLLLQFALCIPLSISCNKAAAAHAESRSDLNGAIVDSFANSTSVKLFARSGYESNFLLKKQRKELKAHIHVLWQFEKLKLLFGLLCFLGGGVAINWYMFALWQENRLTTGDAVFIFNTTWNINMMAWFAALEIPNLFKEWGTCTQALSLIAKPHDIQDHVNAEPLRITQGEIVFDNVFFRYGENANLFRGKNVVIRAGERVGLVGSSGSGKTSFVHLILRYFDVEKGEIRIDGQDIKTVTQESLRQQISLIPQDTSLFHRTILENIRYGNPEATDAEVLQAAKEAHCAEFIEKIPLKYDSLVGERGISLSGGQRQRIAIARAILKKAPIIILDEATSALDSVTEKNIQKSLIKIMQGRTTLVIAALK